MRRIAGDDATEAGAAVTVTFANVTAGTSPVSWNLSSLGIYPISFWGGEMSDVFKMVTGGKETPAEAATRLVNEAREAAPHIDDDTLTDYMTQTAELITSIMADVASVERHIIALVNLHAFIAQTHLFRSGQAGVKMPPATM